MLRPLDDRDTINEHGCTARRNDVADWNFCSLLECRDVRHVPESDHPFLPPELLVKDRWVQDILPRIRVELSQPFVSAFRTSGPRHRARDDRPEYCSHRPGSDRIADEKLPLPLRIQNVIPIRGSLR